MRTRRRYSLWPRLLAATAFVVIIAGCGGAPTTPCDDSDPVGPCATSHSRTRS